MSQIITTRHMYSQSISSGPVIALREQSLVTKGFNDGPHI